MTLCSHSVSGKNILKSDAIGNCTTGNENINFRKVTCNFQFKAYISISIYIMLYY